MRLFDLFLASEKEAFACGVVHYLLLRSPELRDALITTINERVPSIALTNNTHFSCTREWATEDTAPVKTKGRVDILLEVDNAVIGIEAKVRAPLSDDQPHKYIDAVKGHADGLAKIRKRPVHSVIVLLLPIWQMRFAEDMLVSKKSDFHEVTVCALAWDTLFDAWRGARVTDSVARFVVDEFERFVSIQTGSNADFPRLLPLIKESLSEARHDAHYEFVVWLSSAFRGNRATLRTRLQRELDPRVRTYTGYYFLTPQTDGLWGWYGFVDPRFAGDPTGKAPVLVMGTDFDVPDLEESKNVFQRIQFTHEAFSPDAKWWKIRFNKDWDNLNRWREALAPMQKAAMIATANLPVPVN
jgi:hypothetical protein